jgi:hypothetical protein
MKRDYTQPVLEVSVSQSVRLLPLYLTERPVLIIACECYEGCFIYAWTSFSNVHWIAPVRLSIDIRVSIADRLITSLIGYRHCGPHHRHFLDICSFPWPLAVKEIHNDMGSAR